MTTKRDMVEATINSVITNYRSSPIETEAMVAMAMAVLDAGDVFTTIRPKATKQEPMDFSYLRISGWADSDEGGVDLYCDHCSDNIDSIDECTLDSVIITAINHIKENHDG